MGKEKLVAGEANALLSYLSSFFPRGPWLSLSGNGHISSTYSTACINGISSPKLILISSHSVFCPFQQQLPGSDQKTGQYCTSLWHRKGKSKAFRYIKSVFMNNWGEACCHFFLYYKEKCWSPWTGGTTELASKLRGLSLEQAAPLCFPVSEGLWVNQGTKASPGGMSIGWFISPCSAFLSCNENISSHEPAGYLRAHGSGCSSSRAHSILKPFFLIIIENCMFK